MAVNYKTYSEVGLSSLNKTDFIFHYTIWMSFDIGKSILQRRKIFDMNINIAYR